MLFTISLAPGSGVPPTRSQCMCIFSSLYAEFVMSVTVADSSWAAHAYLTPQPTCHSERAQSRLCQDHPSTNTEISTTTRVAQYSCVNLREKQHNLKNLCQTCSRDYCRLLILFAHLLVYIPKTMFEYSHCFHCKTTGNDCSEKLDK